MLDFILVTDNLMWKLPVNVALGCDCSNFSQSFIVTRLPLNNVCYPRYESEVEGLHIDMFFLNDQSFWTALLTAVATTSQPWGWFLTDGCLCIWVMEAPAQTAWLPVLLCFATCGGDTVCKAKLQDMTRGFENTTRYSTGPSHKALYFLFRLSVCVAKNESNCSCLTFMIWIP